MKLRLSMFLLGFFVLFSGQALAMQGGVEKISPASSANVEKSGSDDDGYSAATMKKMSVFLSNFTEIGMRNFDTATMTNSEFIYFGVWHNFINNFKSRIKMASEPGMVYISESFVRESIKKYFNYDLTDLNYSKNNEITWKDGNYYFMGADGEAIYYAMVDMAKDSGEELILMTGYLYNSNDKKDVIGNFEAYAKNHTFGGKKTWSIVSFKIVD